jgi:hypothetical protein
MTTPSDNSLVGQTVEIGLAWRSKIGKIVGTFSVKVVEPTSTDGEASYLVKIAEFKKCHVQDDAGKRNSNGPQFTDMHRLPEPLKNEIARFLEAVIVVPSSVVKHGLVMYAKNPFTLE